MSDEWPARALTLLLILNRRGLPALDRLGPRILSFDEPAQVSLLASSGRDVVRRTPPSWFKAPQDGLMHALRSTTNVVSLTVDPVNGRWIAAGDAEGMVRIVWRAHGPSATFRAGRLYYAAAGRPLQQDAALVPEVAAESVTGGGGAGRGPLLQQLRASAGRPAPAPPRIVAATFLGAELLLTGDTAGRVLAWRRRGPRQPTSLAALPGIVRCLAVSPDGRWVGAAAACFEAWPTGDPSAPVRLALRGGTPTEALSAADCEATMCVAFCRSPAHASPLWLVAGTRQEIRVRSLPDRVLLQVLKGHDHVVRALAVSECGRWVASAGGGSERRRLIVWSVLGGDDPPGGPVFSASHTSELEVNALALSFLSTRRVDDLDPERQAVGRGPPLVGSAAAPSEG
uniref:Uncharacterized protein n=1 Tax=Alexandrium monilatum TaxID=311494 RepID=A0A7S4QAV1_9DINO|mmetsp:Transcript_63807/g.201692  ORF Transcript_63807/g.201692 Transcript_63807/m.201692 type:complete len:399 (+) Transcript_63807:66-1262(+)